MENTDNTNTKAAGSNKKRLITAGVAFCMAALLCLSAYGLYSASVSRKAILDLQAQIDELLQSSSAQSQPIYIDRSAEIEALQARIDELSKKVAATSVATVADNKIPLAAIPEIKDMYSYELKLYFGSEEIRDSGARNPGFRLSPRFFPNSLTTMCWSARP